MIDELAKILGVERQNLPAVFLSGRTQVLKRGIRFDIMQRFPLADPDAILDWLERYTNAKFYLVRFLQNAKNRHDLDGFDAGIIVASDRHNAKKRIGDIHSRESSQP